MGRWRAGVSAAAVALLLTSCSGGAGEANGNRLQGTSLEVMGAWSGTEQSRFSQVLKAFSARTGVAVRYTSAHGRVPGELDARIAAGRIPEVVLLPQPGALRHYARAGLLVPLDADAQRLVQRHYPAVWRNLASYAGQQYGVWFKAANKSLIWYDLSLFERAGLVPPGDLDGLRRVAGTLRERGIAAFALAGGDAWTLTDWFENLHLALAGPDRYDELATHRLPWTDQSVTRTLRAMAALLAPDLLLGGSAKALGAKFEDSVAQAFGSPPAAAMVAEGDFVASVVTTRTRAAIGVDVDAFPFPTTVRGQPMVVAGGDVAVQLRASPAASALLLFLASPDAAAIWAAAGGFLSPNLDLDLAVYPDPLTRSIARGLIEAGDNLRFDLSDLQPAGFGAQSGSGLQGELRRFLGTHDIAGTQRRLEVAASAAFAQPDR